MQQKSKNQNTNGGKHTIRVILNDGTPALLNPKNVRNRTKHSGTASDGTPVNSLCTAEVGKTTIIWNSAGDVFSCLTAELEVMANQRFPNRNIPNNS